MFSHTCKSLGLIVVLTIAATTQIPAYTYTHPTGPDPDISWIPIGNARGQILISELPANLPVINTLRSPGSGKSVVNNQTELSFDYVTTGGTKTGYKPSVYDNVEGIQPVISYVKSGTRITVWPMQMTPVSRQWLQESNILETVTGTADFQLTTDDFVSSTHDVLVRIFTLKNLSATTQSFRILHYLPINPSGRDNYAWETNWKTMASTNAVTYDSASDCMIFRCNPNPVWVVGADQPSSGHECASSPAAQTDITTNGTLSNTNSSGPAVVDAALSYDSPQLAQGASFTVTAFIGIAAASTPQVTALQQFAAVKSSGANLHDTTLAFWQNWLASGRSGQIKDASMKHLVGRLLSVIKASFWDIGGLSENSAELSCFYTRAAMPCARALALFGHWSEAKQILLFKEADLVGGDNGNIMTATYDPKIPGIISAGFSDATIFGTSLHQWSVDDPPNLLFTIGEVWNVSDKSDTAYLRQAWPFIKWLVNKAASDSNIGVMGTIAQNGGFQDDMLKYAWDRPGTGIECSYFNMLWVSGLQMASGIGTTLGHSAEAARYDSLATSIRNNLETKFWSNTYHDYAYIHVPDNRAISGNFDAVSDGVGGRFIFPVQATSSPYTCLAGAKAFPYWYHYASDAHARTSLDSAKARLEPLSTNDLVVSGYYMATWNIVDLLYAQAAAGDATLETTKNWVLRNAPLAGMPEVMPTTDRSVQIWMTGETACALYKYLEATNGFLATATYQRPLSTGTHPQESALTTFRRNNRMVFRFAAAANPTSIALYDFAGKSVALIKLDGRQKCGMVVAPAVAGGMVVAILRDGLNRPIAKAVAAAF